MSRTPHHRAARVRSSQGAAAPAIQSTSTGSADALGDGPDDACGASEALPASHAASVQVRLDRAAQAPSRPLGAQPLGARPPSRLSRALRRLGAAPIVSDAVTIESVTSSATLGSAASIVATPIDAAADAIERSELGVPDAAVQFDATSPIDLAVETADAHTRAMVGESRPDDDRSATGRQPAFDERPRQTDERPDEPTCHDTRPLESVAWELSALVASARQIVLARRYRPPLDKAHSAALRATASRLANEAARNGCRRIAVVTAEPVESMGVWCGPLAAALAALDRGRVLLVESTESLTDASMDAIGDDRTIAWLDGKLDWERAVCQVGDLGFDALAASRDVFQRRATRREPDRQAWLEAASGYAFVLFDFCQWRHAAAPADLPPVDAVVVSVELERTPKRLAREARARWTRSGVRVLGSLALAPLAA